MNTCDVHLHCLTHVLSASPSICCYAVEQMYWLSTFSVDRRKVPSPLYTLRWHMPKLIHIMSRFTIYATAMYEPVLPCSYRAVSHLVCCHLNRKWRQTTVSHGSQQMGQLVWNKAFHLALSVPGPSPSVLVRAKNLFSVSGNCKACNKASAWHIPHLVSSSICLHTLPDMACIAVPYRIDTCSNRC